MGTVDIETALDEFITSGNIYWDEKKFTFDEYADKIKQAIVKVTQLHYAASDDEEIEDWDVWESDVIDEANKLLGNDD